MADDGKIPITGDGDNGKADADLSKLLDSALTTFDKPTGRTTDDELDAIMADADAQAAQTAAKDFQEMLKQMVLVQEENLKKADASGEMAESEKEESKAMMDAMRELIACSGSLADASSPQELVARLEELGNPEGNMEPMMNMMMEAFVSKDVLYPPLKEMHDKYPAYLEQKGPSLDAPTLDRYQKQAEVIGRICHNFEAEDEPSGAEGAEAGGPSKIEILGRLLVELQSHGYPPDELTGGLPEGFAVDDRGKPQIDNVEKAAETCSIM